MPGKLGSGTRNITCNVDTQVWLEIHKLARISGVSVSQYAGTMMTEAAKRGTLVRENAEFKRLWYDALHSGGTLPKPLLEVVPEETLGHGPSGKYTAVRHEEPTLRAAEEPGGKRTRRQK